ncbi:xanthine dehydrogenase, small subunit [Afipia carboxidovorans OM5]|uniref:Xanthine dehydrogenase, flavoprotein XdhA n=1 Tax=Afipia carboxidovorans (strain ATCC 49405 / DSM 1227 / KCTC 32145 / OM5) TaxID=504832 RepID=B6JJ75_AFIC5|nr:xanthine dehydrogenase small subunit [Afipia carboxidovorans]ACI94469.1 xanthine dehydrogenase, small subunit [Afipia carboxidovorans OM5]AEI01901.1 xanthine dehydrogenase, flavoprotein XdhA [Afipia carboxidovorans OM4]AEI05476.1 xanthine dehydrogenase, flavoprotein XdhA [Afipia carboxidovorans OM5]
MGNSGPRTCIRFILNGHDVVLSDVAASDTLLDYLRLRRGMVGSKEGCAAGDCGACTTLIGRLRDGRLVYEAVDSCIRLLASIDGCHVVTVEHLTKPDGRLNPIQQAMVDTHGSQCGFCTPGIVMSLYAMWLASPSPSDATIERTLQGNLCRCTGYEPVMKAARTISHYGSVADDPLKQTYDEIQTRLDKLHDNRRVEIEHGGSRIILPANVDDLADAIATERNPTIVSGATDVGLWVTKDMRAISPAIFTGHLDELKRVTENDASITIGAGLTYSEAFAILPKHFPAFSGLLKRIGGEQVRNMGTIGGNIANGSPIADTPPTLIVLGARLILRKGKSRRTLPLEDFFIDYKVQDRQPGEFVEAIEIPKLNPASRFAVYKISKRRDEDISSVLGAFHLTLNDANCVETIRIAYGGMAGIPKRAKAVEDSLLGQPWTEDTVQAAIGNFAKDFAPLTDMRASAEYRMLVAQNLLRRFHAETEGAGEAVRLVRHPDSEAMHHG